MLQGRKEACQADRVRFPGREHCLPAQGIIDFLICQKPQEQGHKGIMALYNHLVHAAIIERQRYAYHFLITRGNYMNYKN